MTTQPTDELKARAQALGMWGLLVNWEQLGGQDWVPRLLELEEVERARRSLQRRIANARIGAFKAMCDFDWDWPRKINRELVDELFSFQFFTFYLTRIQPIPNNFL